MLERISAAGVRDRAQRVRAERPKSGVARRGGQLVDAVDGQPPEQAGVPVDVVVELVAARA